MVNIKRKIGLILILSIGLVTNAVTQVTVNWLTETGIAAGNVFVDGQVINNIAGTGLNAVINVNIVGGSPRTATTGTIAAIGPSTGNAAGASFTLTFLNGTADVLLENQQNLLTTEDIWVSNPDGLPITVTQTATNSGRIKVDGTSISSNPLPQSIIGDSNVEIIATNGGSGNDFHANMTGVSGFTWLYETNGQFEGFTLKLSNTVLPVELTSFDVSNLPDSQVKLKWQTASELNNDYFSIEKSEDGLNWEVLDRIDGNGTTSYSNDYHYIDENPFINLTYYRLKQTDFDGQFSYSDTKYIWVNPSGEFKVYPNPASQRITLDKGNFGESELLIFDISMKEITNLVRIYDCDDSMCQLDLSNIPSGLYFIKTPNELINFIKK